MRVPRAAWLPRASRSAVPLVVRVLWFVLVGWWLGLLWVLLSWSVFLLPYPFLDTVAALPEELPSVVTLAYPEPRGGTTGVRSPVHPG